ncbi:cell envelope integrity protein TolA, partial [Escherichia coli]
MYCRAVPVLVLILASLTTGCTKDVSTNNHDASLYHSDKLIKSQNLSSSERTPDASEEIRQYA